MHIASPFFVVPVIAVVFFACIWVGATTREDGAEHH
jgi:hypothetical protein